MKKFLALAMLSLMLGCASQRVDPQRFWCETNKKICLTDDQRAGMSRRQKEEALGHNEYGLKICPKSWNVSCPK